MENYSFRLVVSSDCFPDLLSEPAGITLLQPPTAAFDAAVSGFSVEFENLSSNADSYFWDFGDGQTSAASNPIYNYASDGEYTVTLVAANECGADTATASVTISNLPVAAFSASPTTGCAPLTVNFDSFDSQNVGSFSWSFPGGVPATSSQADPVVVYNTPGSFGATLIVNNNSGADTLALENLITVADIPTAGFTIASTDLTAVFTNTSSGATSYLWDFGDDATSAQPNPTHTYANPGTYTITLTAVNQCGQVSTSQTIMIGEILQAGFGYSLAGGCAPHTVQFFDESTGNITGWAWTFPGGNPAGAAVPNPVVVYSTPGQYDVTLVVSGAQGGNSLTVQGLVDILPTPEASFTVQLDQLTASFTNLSVNAAFYLWDFGDGNTSTESDPVHTYALPGAYDVTLNAQNAYCGNAVGKTILATTTGTGEYFSGTAVKVFPNPARELIYLEWQDQLAGPLNIRLFTADGRVVWDRMH
jgi:PKD repeat protein